MRQGRRSCFALGVHTFLDLETEKLEDVGEVDVVPVHAGGTLVTLAEPPQTQPSDGRALYFLVEPDGARLAARVRDGRLARRAVQRGLQVTVA